MECRVSHRILAGGIVLALLVGLAWALGIGTPGYTNLPRPFNSEAWKAADGWDETRCGMVADLQYRLGLVGRTEAEITQLLGPPTQRQGNTTEYHLCPSLADIYILELQWLNGRVASMRVRDT